MSSSLSVITVAFNSADDLARTLPALASELASGDEVIVVDNGSSDDLQGVVAATLPEARILPMDGNAGYTAAINHGAAMARGDLLVVLNPDAMPEPGFGQAIRRPENDGSEWAAWMSLVVCHEGGRRLINSTGNPLHFLGFCWAGDHGLPAEAAGESRPVATMSGACLAIPRSTWNRTGGFSDHFFLYQEDTDLSLRLRLTGEQIGLLTEAVVDHDYDFGRRSQKYLWLERNRWAMMLRNYPTPLLLLLAPALLMTEIALVAVASRGGWLEAKMKANRDLLRWMPRLLGERRRIQATRQISTAAFAAMLTPDLDSDFFPAFVRSAPTRLLLRGYWRLVRALLRD
ncbi:MAG: glycosyltransferase family 2 protein [Solirubrobacterales bacterium]